LLERRHYTRTMIVDHEEISSLKKEEPFSDI